MPSFSFYYHTEHELGLASLIELRNLSKTYVTSSGEHTALSDINLTIEDGEIFGIIGVSGAGKSTLVRCINLLERPTSGRVLVDGADVTDYSGKQLLQLRSHIGMIFQDFDVFAQRTVAQNVAFPLELAKVPAADRKKRVDELLELVGLSDKAGNYPAQLSGGQQQRVAIARALANRPDIMLCDEATSALDTLTTNSVLKLLRDINRKLGVTLVVITHSMDVVEKVCQRVAVIDGSHIVEQGSVKEVFANPATTITKRLLGQVKWDD